MIIKDRLEQLKQDKFMVIHKIYPEGIQLQEFDWIRIYKSKNRGCIDDMIYSLDVRDINSIPNDILLMDYDEENCWMIGGYLSLDLIIEI